MAHPPAVTPPSLGLHRFAVALAALGVLLLTAGALVTSRAAGLSVPDWPLSFGQLNPEGWWRDPAVRTEHGHRLFAAVVALLTLTLAVWAQRARAPQRVRRLGWWAVAAVAAQGALGGATVLLLVPTPVSVAHAALAHAFLAVLVTLAVWTAPAALDDSLETAQPRRRQRLARLALGASVVLYLQVLLGAAVRHSGAGLAIPEFPLTATGWLPAQWSLPVALHFGHRLGGVAAVAAIAAVTWTVWWPRPLAPRLLLPATLMLALVPVQAVIGGLVVLSRRAEVPNTLHVTAGAILWTASWMLTLRSRE
jgi:heme a synthase